MNTIKQRCPWVNLSNSAHIDHHDREWGTPIHDDNTHFELLILSGLQTRLFSETILNNRTYYRKVFCKFDPKKVAKFSADKIEKLLQDQNIINSRLNVESIVNNAKVIIAIQKEFKSFDNYIWQFIDHVTIINNFTTVKDYPIKTTLSDKISKDLKKRGFINITSSRIYSYLQAAGLVHDHVRDCYKSWHVYMVRCNDNSLYTGITNNVAKRVAEHNAQTTKSAKYLRGKTPCTLVYTEYAGNKSWASKREVAIKKMSKSAKEQLTL